MKTLNVQRSTSNVQLRTAELSGDVDHITSTILPLLSTTCTPIEIISFASSAREQDMSAEIKKEIQLEIAHVLFIDIVGYSKPSVNDQHATVEELNQIVRASKQFQKAQADSRLLKIPDRRRHGAGFLQEPARASGMRGGNQSRSQRIPAATTSDGRAQADQSAGLRM
jgi:hypothetical protein